jgi:hypothetical protein
VKNTTAYCNTKGLKGLVVAQRHKAAKILLGFKKIHLLFIAVRFQHNNILMKVLGMYSQNLLRLS